MLPHVVRWNAGLVADRYQTLLAASGRDGGRDPGGCLADRLDALARVAALPRSLRDLGVPRAELDVLAAEAATQWTGTCNPRPFDADAALQLYERAF